MAEKVTFSDSFTTYIQGEARAMALAVSVREAAQVALERFESCASGLVPDDYARGYREACDHIGQDAARAITEGNVKWNQRQTKKETFDKQS
jgi:hypothetical protein